MTAKTEGRNSTRTSDFWTLHTIFHTPKQIYVGFGDGDAERVVFMVLFADSETHRTKNGLVPL